MRMRKWLCLLVSLLLLFTLVSCGDETPQSSAPAADSSALTDDTGTSTTEGGSTTLSETSTTTTSITTTTTTTTTVTTTGKTTTKKTEKPTVPSVLPTTKKPTTTTTTTKKPDTAQPSSTPLLYRVRDGKGHEIWLFGSIHVGRDSFYPLPAYVMNAYNQADALAVECDMIAFGEDVDAQYKAFAQLVYTDGTTIADHLPQDVYQRGVAILKESQAYQAALDYYCPAMWASLIDSLTYEKVGADSEKGIDLHLLNTAYAQGKEIVEIESVQQQYAMLAGFSEALQQTMLYSSIIQYDDPAAVKKEMGQTMDQWATGSKDQYMMRPEDGQYANIIEKQLYEEYYNAMCATRNQAMADYAESALRNGKEVFICVGIAHVVGEGAIADLLAERGYTVESIR